MMTDASSRALWLWMLSLLQLLLLKLMTSFDVANSFAVTLSQKNSDINVIPRLQWIENSQKHVEAINELLFPPGASLKSRMHIVKEHPVYNFLHTYYRYSYVEISKYSPGCEAILVDVCDSDADLLSKKYLKVDANTGTARYDLSLIHI